ncbi:NAD(P)H-dependent oxidoreductase [Mesoplasma entomophilum]|uniref:hypothetical protein n=1 Tax=Mesoplasma entomophilum TaxID=2149 RepID=UPI000CA2868C|nr:hypothetical protein [Mesoplasma entomophilum]ATZ19406.1 NAD(P)H-dependent oxidoreductase [Mesoplasma entomophilum]
MDLKFGDSETRVANKLPIIHIVAPVVAASLDIDTCMIGGFNAKVLGEYLIQEGLMYNYETPFITIAFGKSTKISGEKLRSELKDFVKEI